MSHARSYFVLPRYKPLPDNNITFLISSGKDGRDGLNGDVETFLYDLFLFVSVLFVKLSSQSSVTIQLNDYELFKNVLF